MTIEEIEEIRSLKERVEEMRRETARLHGRLDIVEALMPKRGEVVLEGVTLELKPWQPTGTQKILAGRMGFRLPIESIQIGRPPHGGES